MTDKQRRAMLIDVLVACYNERELAEHYVSVMLDKVNISLDAMLLTYSLGDRAD